MIGWPFARSANADGYNQEVFVHYVAASMRMAKVFST